MDRNLQIALTEGYASISGHPLQEGILAWLFGSGTSPSEELSDKVNKIFDNFYEREQSRLYRANSRMSMDGYSGRADAALIQRVDSMRQGILREISKYGRQLDKAVKERDKAYRVRDDYSDKLDYMRDSRDEYRKKARENRKRR